MAASSRKPGGLYEGINLLSETNTPSILPLNPNPPSQQATAAKELPTVAEHKEDESAKPAAGVVSCIQAY